MVIKEFQEPLASELGAIVHDDAVGNPKAMDDISEE
jgi:Flp pilus assembly protein TadB